MDPDSFRLRQVLHKERLLLVVSKAKSFCDFR